MRVAQDLDKLKTCDSPVVLAIGFFDGVHKGHQAVIEATQQLAREHDAEPWLLTFDPHPLKTIRPAAAPPLLTSTPHKLRLFEELGLAGVIVQEFNTQLRETEAADFLSMLSRAMPKLRHVVVGENWTFGHNRHGTTDTLEHLTKDLSFDVSRVSPVKWGEEPISSTRIRKAVGSGDLKSAATMLGRSFSIFGDVVHGDKVGRALGFPTANIDPHNEVHPPDGIYAALAKVEDKVHQAAAYVGHRPTLNDGTGPWVVEAHLMDLNTDLYGQLIEVLFIEKIRDDLQFESRELLIAQIGKDVSDAREMLSKKTTHE